MTEFTQKPYLNLGAGRTHLPGPQPAHHGLVDAAIYQFPLWVNADRNAEPGVDLVFDAFRYPWPIASDSYDGALLSHLCEHIPHGIRLALPHGHWLDHVDDYIQRCAQLEGMQDGWFAFWSEVWRVCTPGAIIHILSPYAWSAGAVTDPTHTRYLTEHVWTHSMQPDANSPFAYATGGLNLRLVEPVRFSITEMFAHLASNPAMLQHALMTNINVAFEMCAKLEVVK